jgi:hypothetical protein
MKKRLFIWILVLLGGFTSSSPAATFEGTYLINGWQEANILDTVNTLSQSELTLTIREDDSLISVTAGETYLGDYSILSDNLAELRSLAEGDGVYSLLLSNESHLSMAYISDKTNGSGEREISLLNGSWLSSISEQPADISSLFGVWNLTQYGNPNLRSGIVKFGFQTMSVGIKAGYSSDTVMVQFPENWIEMQVSGSRVFLDSNQGPVDTGNGILHQFEAWFDEAGFSYTWIMVEEDDDTDVAVQIGYSTSQVPIPGSLLLFTTGLLGLALFWERRLFDI